MATEKLNRKKLIEKATELFTRQGYHNTSMNDVAKICAVKKGSLYHHIPSRKALMIAVVEYVVATVRQECFSLAYEENTPVSRRLSRLLGTIEASCVGAQCHCLLSSLMLETVKEIPEVLPMVKSYFNDWIAAIAYLLGPQYGETKSKEYAAEAVSHLHGSIILGNLFQDVTVIQFAINRVASLLPPA